MDIKNTFILLNVCIKSVNCLKNYSICANDRMCAKIPYDAHGMFVDICTNVCKSAVSLQIFTGSCSFTFLANFNKDSKIGLTLSKVETCKFLLGSELNNSHH